MKYFYAIAFLGWSFAGGYWYHGHEYGEVRLSHNMKIDGDPLNRGQLSLEVIFPSSIRLGQIQLPYGGFYPDDRPRWVEVTGPNGQTKDWLDRLSFESYEFGAKDVAPTFKQACLKMPSAPVCPPPT